MGIAIDPATVRRLLIFRTGSIGDTVAALPCFHLLRRAFPEAERRVLTNFPVNSAAAPLQSVLGDAGFVHGYFRFTLGVRHPGRILALRREIAAWAPDCGVYLRERRHAPQILRDAWFMRLCGVPVVLAADTDRDLTRHRGPDANGVWEAEGARLARCLADIGDARVTDPASRDLCFSAGEKAEAEALLAGWAGRTRFAVFAIGTKLGVNEWGDDNWTRTLRAVSEFDPGLGLVLVGALGDAIRAGAVAAGWRGPLLDLCGRCGPRVSAVVIGAAALLFGHDSGPMHLASAVGTPAIVVYSTRVKPGVWFPVGARNRVFYPGLAFSGGDPPVMRVAGGEHNITQIPADQVIAAARDILKGGAGGPVA